MWTSVVEISVNSPNVNPGIEAIWLPDLFPLAFILQTQAEIPV